MIFYFKRLIKLGNQFFSLLLRIHAALFYVLQITMGNNERDDTFEHMSWRRGLIFIEL
jgi:hypothetical protein